MSIKWFLYKIALKYIGWCNGRQSVIMYGHLKNIDRLTYRNCDFYAKINILEDEGENNVSTNN